MTVPFLAEVVETTIELPAPLWVFAAVPMVVFAGLLLVTFAFSGVGRRN